MMKLLEAVDITKKYIMGEVEVNALKGISFDINEGELIVILGSSGSGKSTLLNIVGGIDRASTGKMCYLGKDISKYNNKMLTEYRKTAIGFIFQFYNLIPNLNVAENIQLAANLTKNNVSVNELIAKVGLNHRKNNFPSQLSGGEQQRVAIARALAKEPKILLCDEPTGALDFATSIDVLGLLWNFNKNQNKTIIIITHNNSIASIADRIFYMRDGLLKKIEKNNVIVNPKELVY